MDPNANIREQLRLAMQLDCPQDYKGSFDDLLADAQRLAELVDALDGWLIKGGFLPDRWNR